jgi:type III pantothenate kinase
MILCLDVGNTQIYGGLIEGEKIHLRFRKESSHKTSADEFGVFLRTVLRENGIEPALISDIAIASVVPDIVHSLRGGCEKYFGVQPFLLQAGVKTGLKLAIRNPAEVGADRIANAIGATAKYPGQNLLIVDFGTATTFCAVNSKQEYCGGAIAAGVRISMEALESRTARLPKVEIKQPEFALGRSTVECIQSALYFGTIGMVKELTERISRECFGDQPVLVIGTGGFSRFFEDAKLFSLLEPDLILLGLRRALELNR